MYKLFLEAVKFLLEREARTTHDSVAEGKARSLLAQIVAIEDADDDEPANPLTYLPHQEAPVAEVPVEPEESDPVPPVPVVDLNALPVVPPPPSAVAPTEAV